MLPVRNWVQIQGNICSCSANTLGAAKMPTCPLKNPGLPNPVGFAYKAA